MKGIVFWESQHPKTELVGEVTELVQQGDEIKILFKCTNLGEGQIALANITDEQSVSSLFLYLYHQEASQFDVRGRFTRGPHIMVFEGLWTDRLDVSGKWKFTMELGDIETLSKLSASGCGINSLQH